MEGFPVVIILLIIFGFVQKYAKKANKDEKKGAPPVKAAQPAPAKAIVKMPEPEDEEDKVGEDIQDAVNAFLAQVAKEATPQEQAAPSGSLPMGESVQDDQGCVGGSLVHHDEEGETRDEHASHLREMARDERDREEARQTAAAIRQAGMAQMRRAVILSEILDKPKALRRR